MPSWTLPIISLYWIDEPLGRYSCYISAQESTQASHHSPFGSAFAYLNFWLFSLANEGEGSLWHLFISCTDSQFLVIGARDRDSGWKETPRALVLGPPPTSLLLSSFSCLLPSFPLLPLTLVPQLFHSSLSCHAPHLIGWNHLPRKWPTEETWLTDPRYLPHTWP